jgi:Tol biopolymer transport system component
VGGAVKASSFRAVSLLSSVALIVGASPAMANRTVLMSVSSAERQANQFSENCMPSRDGRYVAFLSYASYLAPKDGNDGPDVFRRDRVTGVTALVSATAAGASGNDSSGWPRISPDGRFVAFPSDASNLVSPPSTGTSVLLRNVAEGKTVRFPPTVDGKPINDFFEGPHAVSNGGRFVSFDSNASNLVRGDTNGVNDAFLYNSRTGRVIRVSVGPNGQGNADSGGGAMSSDGRFVAFWSRATNLVPGDTNGEGDVYLRDRRLGTVAKVSLGSNGEQGNDDSADPAVSDDGRFVAFLSYADNLVPDDSDGQQDLFLRDLKTKTTVNLTPGDLVPGGSQRGLQVTISADGRYVSLHTDAALVPADTNGSDDAYLYDRLRKGYILVSVGNQGQLGNGGSFNARIGANGSAVAFESSASNLVPRDRNGTIDCFLRTR